MKTRRIEKHDKSGQLLGYDDKHVVMETTDDVVAMLRVEDGKKLTVADCNSGYSVRRQRELAGSMTADERRDAIANDNGFGTWAELLDAAKRARALNG